MAQFRVNSCAKLVKEIFQCYLEPCHSAINSFICEGLCEHTDADIKMTYRLIYYIRCECLQGLSLFMWKYDTFFVCIFLASTQKSSCVISLHAVSPFQVRTVR